MSAEAKVPPSLQRSDGVGICLQTCSFRVLSTNKIATEGVPIYRYCHAALARISDFIDLLVETIDSSHNTHDLIKKYNLLCV